MAIKKLDLDLMPQLKKTELRAKRKVLGRILEGSWTTLLKGRGMEFAGFRKYTYGDDASMIDWGASLRSKETLVREFEEFKNVNVFFLLDVSDSMLFSSEGKLKVEYGAELLFNLSVALIDNGDSVGYAMFNDNIVAKMPPNIGKEAVYRIAAGLQNPKNYGGKFDFQNVVSLLNSILRERALIIIISDFIGMEEGWERYIKMIGQKFDLIGIMLRDPRDRTLPKKHNNLLVEDPYTHEKLLINSKEYKDIFENFVKEEESYIHSVFKKSESGFLLLESNQDIFTPIMRYFKKRSAIIR